MLGSVTILQVGTTANTMDPEFLPGYFHAIKTTNTQDFHNSRTQLVEEGPLIDSRNDRECTCQRRNAIYHPKKLLDRRNAVLVRNSSKEDVKNEEEFCGDVTSRPPTANIVNCAVNDTILKKQYAVCYVCCDEKRSEPSDLTLSGFFTNPAASTSTSLPIRRVLQDDDDRWGDHQPTISPKTARLRLAKFLGMR